MTNLFKRYDEVRFDVFHISYPFQKKLAVLAKNYPNVYIDGVLAGGLTPQQAVRGLP